MHLTGLGRHSCQLPYERKTTTAGVSRVPEVIFGRTPPLTSTSCSRAAELPWCCTAMQHRYEDMDSPFHFTRTFILINTFLLVMPHEHAITSSYQQFLHMKQVSSRCLFGTLLNQPEGCQLVQNESNYRPSICSAEPIVSSSLYVPQITGRPGGPCGAAEPGQNRQRPV